MVADRICTNITSSISNILFSVGKVLNKPKSNAYGQIWPLTLVIQKVHLQKKHPLVGGREGVWQQNIYTKLLYRVLLQRFRKGETELLVLVFI